MKVRLSCMQIGNSQLLLYNIKFILILLGMEYKRQSMEISSSPYGQFQGDLRILKFLPSLIYNGTAPSEVRAGFPPLKTDWMAAGRLAKPPES